MTGGVVAVLGQVGINFGSGMTGGLAFVLDREQVFLQNYNRDSVEPHRLAGKSMLNYRDYLLGLVREHATTTGSRWSRELCDHYHELHPDFWLIRPKNMELTSLLDFLMAA